MPELITKWHKWQKLFLFALAGLLLLSWPPTLAQDGERILVPDSTLSGALEPEAAAASYVFDATAGAAATVTAVSADAALALLISDSNGNVMAQAVDTAASGAVRVDNAPLTDGGRYFVVVYLAPGSAAAAAAFDLTLTLDDGSETIEVVPVLEADIPATAAPVPDQILIAGGIEVSLDWTGAADMNLQVRDPSGETLYWDSRITSNGGIFGFDANGLCEVISASPVETATWQPGFLPTGSYEILVFYREVCDAGVLSVPFSVAVTVDGASSGTIDGVLAPPRPGQDSVYVARFEVDGDGAATVHAGGVYPDSSLTLLPSAFDISSNVPIPIRRDAPAVGEINNQQTFATYSFVGAAGEVISVDMQALGPNLDTLLQIVDSRGAVISVNDDADGTTTDSFIGSARLLNDDTYTIIATRYGKELGGTEGQFQLTLSGPANDVPLELAALQLPQGDIEVTLLWGTSADLQLLVRDPIGEVVFDDVPFSNSGGILQENGNVNCVPADAGAPVSYIYWPLGRIRPGAYEVEVWYQNACADLPTPVEFTLVIEVAGETIAVERRFPLVDQRFVTSFTVLPSGEASAGDGGFIDGGSQTLAYQPEILSAPVILSGQAQTGVITPSNSFDLYSFDGVTGETVTISMSAATQTLDANLFLISPSGQEIAANDDADPALLGAAGGLPTDSIISELILPENGPYTIIATRFATQYGGTIGGYTLTMNKN